ncbi:MAG TPA: glucose-6-phosphate dehydrogenase, partial [Kineobactrum sp.]
MSSAVDLIIFGTRSDLSRRKLFPALYQLDRAGLLDDGVRIAGLARDDISNADFAADIEQTLREAFTKANIDDESCQRFCARLQYLYVDFSQPDQYSTIKQWLASDRIAIYYLATPPSLFGMISEHLGSAGCITHDSRIVLEKPIGHDLASSRQVNDAVASCFDESNIYRIDHYLGKETVQNLLALRFANRMINSQWDNSCVDHVQITAAETVGIEGRWSYYDKVGQLRDMIQNHVLQLLCMVAMEPPNSLRADEIRAEKVKILRALSPITAATVAEQAVRGQ